MLQHLERFHHIASRSQLGATAILLWQMLYLYMSRRGSFVNFAMSTNVFLDQLHISRQGLLQARKSLEDAGLLRTELGDDQHLRYTLCQNGLTLKFVNEKQEQRSVRVVSEEAAAAMAEPLAQQPEQANVCAEASTQHAPTMQAVAEQNAACEAIFANAAVHRGDIVMNEAYKGYLHAVESRFGVEVRYALHSWLKQRQNNGWTLTLWGLEELLQNLIRLAAGEVSRMVDIVKQSIRRKWKGFFALRVQSKPSGEKLVKEEKQAQQQSRTWGKTNGKPAYETDDTDLSIFEE